MSLSHFIPFYSHVVRLMLKEEMENPRRRRHNQAFTMILMGIVIFLMFFVTLGFQFLATFGGKAFLMAKMALLLASINGIKKVSDFYCRND
jgi:O-antigen ligase